MSHLFFTKWKLLTLIILSLTAGLKVISYFLIDFTYLPPDEILGLSQDKVLLLVAIIEASTVIFVLRSRSRLLAIGVVLTFCLSAFLYRAVSPISQPCPCLGKSLGMIGIGQAAETKIATFLLVVMSASSALILAIETNFLSRLRTFRHLMKRFSLCFILLFTFTAVRVIIHGPLILGGDEGMESAKALLVKESPNLVEACWNDQPWFYSIILGRVLRSNLALGRAFTLMCLLALIIVIYKWIPTLSLAGDELVTFPIWLLLWPNIFHLGISSMMELPSYAWTFSGLVLFYAGIRKGRVALVLLAALLSGVGCAIKLTGLMLGPSFVAVAVALVWMNPPVGRRRIILLSTLALTFFVAILALLLKLGHSNSFDMMWVLHRNAAKEIPADRVSELSLSFRHFADMPAISAIAVVGAVFAVVRRHQTVLLLGVIPLASALIINFLNRPFWSYYTIHFAVPGAICAAYALSLIPILWSRSSVVTKTYWSALEQWKRVAFTIIALVCTGTLGAFEASEYIGEVRKLHTIPSFDQIPMAQLIRQYAPYTRFGWSFENAMMAQAGILLPPEITIVSQKRFWTKQIDTDRILNVLVRYEPELLFLRGAQVSATNWNSFLREKYVLVGVDQGSFLYASKSISGNVVNGNAQRIRNIIR